MVCVGEARTKIGRLCRGQEHGAVTNNGKNGPHPLDPPLPTLGEGEDLAKNRQKSSIFVRKTPPLPKLGEGVGG